MEQTEKRSFRIKNIASTLVLCAAVVLCLLIAVQVMTRGYATLGGYSVFRVVTGSMEPTIPVNALVVSRKTDMGQIAVGDIIVFRSRVTLSDEKVITHRVAAVTETDGAPALETRGDANPVADSRLVRENDLIGKVTWHSHQGGGLVKVIGFLSGKFGFLACIVFPILLLGGLVLRSSIDSIRRQLDQVAQEIDDRPASQAGGGDYPPPQMPEGESLLSAAEYKEIYDRVKAEILEELKQDGKGIRE